MLDFIIIVLATAEIIEIWRHGSIFAALRARLECYSGFLPDLLLCPFCLSPWVALFVVAAMTYIRVLDAATTHLELAYLLQYIVMFPLYALAAAKAANLLNDLTHNVSRTPHPGELPGPADPKSTFENKGESYDIEHSE